MMNLLKQLWNWFITPSADGCCDVPHKPTLVVVEEDDGDVAEIFTNLCIEAGIQKRWVVRYNMASIFFAWYDGPANIENIKASIPQFKAEHPEMAPKLARLK